MYHSPESQYFPGKEVTGETIYTDFLLFALFCSEFTRKWSKASVLRNVRLEVGCLTNYLRHVWSLKLDTSEHSGVLRWLTSAILLKQSPVRHATTPFAQNKSTNFLLVIGQFTPVDFISGVKLSDFYRDQRENGGWRRPNFSSLSLTFLLHVQRLPMD